MQKIAETVGEFLKGDCGRSRLITGGILGGHYYMLVEYLLVLKKTIGRFRTICHPNPYNHKDIFYKKVKMSKNLSHY